MGRRDTPHAARGACEEDHPQNATGAEPLVDVDAATIGCPLHFAMAQLAQAAVMQHVRYAQGEYASQPDLIQALHVWTHLHDLIRTQVCGISRAERMRPRQLESNLDVAFASLPADLSTATKASLRRTVARCAACGHADACPLDRYPDTRLLG